MRSLALFLFGMGMAALVGAAGCGRIAKNVPEVGGESHFLHWCDGSCEEEGLQCISGLCTQPCVVAEPNACSAFSGASCTDRSIEPGAVAICDVGCSNDTDCAALGSDYRCEASFCRAPGIRPLPSLLPDARGGGGGAPASDASAMAGGGGDTAPTASGPDWPSLSWQDTRQGVGPGDVRTPQSMIVGCSYSHHYRAGFYWDAPPEPCNVQLDCSAPELGALNELLRDPLFNMPKTKQFFGLPPSEADGVLVEIEPAFMLLWAGPPCGSAQSCSDVPPILETLLRQLQAIDALALPDPACAAYAPGADAGPPVTGL